MVVADNQILNPPVGGGRVRISSLYKNFSDDFHIDYLGMYDNPAPEHSLASNSIGKNLTENLIPMTCFQWFHQQQEQAQYPNQLIADILFPKMVQYSPQYKRVLDRFSQDAVIFVASHPWVEPLIQTKGKEILIYDSHNCETLIKKELFSEVPGGHILYKETKKMKKGFVRKRILFLSAQKRTELIF